MGSGTGTTWPSEGLVVAGRYELDGLIAHGGVGSVWLACDPVLSRDVVVKFLHPHLAADEDVATRFRLEGLAAARIASSNAARIYDAGEDGGLSYLVMEHIDGPGLRDVIARAPLADEVTAAIGVQIADALDAAHRMGIVHRDVKPENVLLTRTGSVKVVDFGLAKTLDTLGRGLTLTGSILGSPAYIAPEQITGESVSSAADLYSLGVILWECAVGRRAFDRETVQATLLARLSDDLPDPRETRPGIAPELADTIVELTSRDPAARPDGADVVRRRLEGLAGDRPERVTRGLVGDADDAGDDPGDDAGDGRSSRPGG